METLLYLYDEVHISAELLEYLIEYCVSKGSPSMAYIKKVGLSWAQQKITTVSQAKEETNLYNKNYFTILRAFGISNRNPLDKEIQYMNLWLNQYGFTLDIITEACSRHGPVYGKGQLFLMRTVSWKAGSKRESVIFPILIPWIWIISRKKQRKPRPDQRRLLPLLRTNSTISIRETTTWQSLKNSFLENNEKETYCVTEKFSNTTQSCGTTTKNNFSISMSRTSISGWPEEQIPRLGQIRQEIAALGLKKARLVLGASGGEDFDLESAIGALAKERKALLLENGFPADYLELHYDCPDL